MWGIILNTKEKLDLARIYQVFMDRLNVDFLLYEKLSDVVTEEYDSEFINTETDFIYSTSYAGIDLQNYLANRKLLESSPQTFCFDKTHVRTKKGTKTTKSETFLLKF